MASRILASGNRIGALPGSSGRSDGPSRPSARSLLLGALPRCRPLRLKFRVVAEVDGDQAVEFVILQRRPAPAGQFRQVGPVGPFPGPLDGRPSRVVSRQSMYPWTY